MSFASDALSAVGYQISSTSSQNEALRWIESEKFDFLLSDIKMPEMDGITLAQKAIEIDPELGILFMTGFADVETAKDAISTGAYDYIMKPFELQEIRNSIANAVKRKEEITEKGSSKGLSKLSDLMGELYTIGDSQSLLKLILSFALLHFDIKEGCILLFDLKSSNLKLVNSKNIKHSAFSEIELPLEGNLPAELNEFKEIHNVEGCHNHPLFKMLASNKKYTPLKDIIQSEAQKYLTSFTVNTDETLKLVLTLKSERKIELKEADHKLLTVMLSLSAVSLENLILFEEAKTAITNLENLQEQLIGLERIATQGMMSAEIAHELNNFLTIITSNLELYEMKVGDQLPEGVDKYLNNVKRHLKKVEKFTTSLSDAGKITSNKSVCDLNEMVDDIVTFAVHQKRFHKIKVSATLDPKLPKLNLDYQQMQQLLYNMLNNAADAIDNESKEGVISVATITDEDNSRFTLQIVDNGSGFNPEELQKAFKDRFTTKESGHGFGLMACKRIITGHGGEIQVESEENKGSTISITIPYNTSPDVMEKANQEIDTQKIIIQ